MDLLAQAAEQAAEGQTTCGQTNVTWYNQGASGGSAFTAALLERQGQGVNAVSPEQGTAQQRGGRGAGGEGVDASTAQREQVRAGSAGEDTAGGNLFRILEKGGHTRHWRGLQEQVKI